MSSHPYHSTTRIAVTIFILVLAGCTAIEGNKTPTITPSQTQSTTSTPTSVLQTSSSSTSVETTIPPLDVSSTEPVQPSDGTVRIAALGDTGTGTVEQYAVANLMASTETNNEFDYDAVVLLGDMIYEEGDPELIDRVVRRPYARVLGGKTVLVPALGNHDVQLEQGDRIMAELGAPGRWYSVDIGSVRLIVLDSTRPDDQAQLAWLESALAGADGRWLIAAFHHAAYSAGKHGSDESTQTFFVPLFAQHEVDLVLSGHDHDYQRSKPIRGVTYVVSGGGAKLRSTGYANFTVVSASELHFVDITVDDTTLTLVARGLNGLIDSFTLSRYSPFRECRRGMC